MRNILILLILIITGCGVSKRSTNALAREKEEILEIIVQNSDDNRLAFRIVNNSDSVITINDPEDIRVEKVESGSWRKLRILPCPCDAPCSPPIEKERLNPNDFYILYWNKEESWCGKERVKNVRNTVKQPAGTGIYRIRIDILVQDRRINHIYKEFSIK